MTLTSLFSPRRPDGRSEYRVVYDETSGLPYGATITFGRLGELLETRDRGRIYKAVARCNLQFTRDGLARYLGSNRGTGYRVLRPEEYTPAALLVQKEAARKQGKAVAIAQLAPTEDMTAKQRNWHHTVTMVLIDNELRLRNHDHRLAELERQNAAARLAELERRAGITPPDDQDPS